MEKRMLGRTGMEVSVLGFGGAEIGFENASLQTVDRLLGAALDAGLNVIDTGECYGASEELIGRATAHRREQYFVFTKCGHTGADFGMEDWDPAMLRKSIDRSLQRLRTDRIDLVHLHTCGEDILRAGDATAVLQEARDAGKIRFIGYSGDAGAAEYAVRSGAFDSLQTSINIADQEAVERTLPLAREHSMGVIAKRPIANVAWRDGKQKPENEYLHTYWERLQKLDYEFTEDVQEGVAVALLWTLATPGVHTAIVGTKSPERWVRNAALLERGPLSQEAWQSIRTRWNERKNDDWMGQT